jgi:hypothetical protein
MPQRFWAARFRRVAGRFLASLRRVLCARPGTSKIKLLLFVSCQLVPEVRHAKGAALNCAGGGDGATIATVPSDPISYQTRDPQADDDARDRRDEARAQKALTRNDRGHRGVITLVVGVLLAAGLAVIWHSIS